VDKGKRKRRIPLQRRTPVDTSGRLRRSSKPEGHHGPSMIRAEPLAHTEADLTEQQERMSDRLTSPHMSLRGNAGAGSDSEQARTTIGSVASQSPHLLLHLFHPRSRKWITDALRPATRPIQRRGEYDRQQDGSQGHNALDSSAIHRRPPWFHSTTDVRCVSRRAYTISDIPAPVPTLSES
jgi:hypothetical protein